MSEIKTISLFHPFSAEAIGLRHWDLLYSHSKPHTLALQDLQKENFDVTVDYFYTHFIPQTKEVNTLKKRFWPVIFPLFFRRQLWRKEHSLWHLLFNKFNPPDLTIINMSGLLSPYTLKIAKVLTKKKKPYIAMIGGINMSVDAQAIHYYNLAHHIIVHTELQKKTLSKLDGFRDLNIHVIPLGVDTNLFKPSLSQETDLINLLFVGRISRLKQIELTIDALAYCRQKGKLNARLTIIGPISDTLYYQELLQKINQQKLSEYIDFKGALEHNVLVAYYQSASLLLLPSVHESFGMVMVEAMACGTPVVALKGSGGPDEIVNNGINGILTDKENYKIEVYNLISNTLKFNKFKLQSRLTVLNKFNLLFTIELLKKSIKMALN